MLVDSNDQAIGLREKIACHEGNGVLHRAISVFLFDAQKRLLLTRRHDDKALWGGYWSNSCCTHPFFGEQPVEAAKRRVREELGLATELEFVYKFEYQAAWRLTHAENELCSVFIGHSDTEPMVNPLEISEWHWIEPAALDGMIGDANMLLTPWLKLEWAELKKQGLVA